jgi:hypothetical protein
LGGFFQSPIFIDLAELIKLVVAEVDGFEV